MLDYQKLLDMWRDEKKKRQEVNAENEKLKADLARANEDRQFDNLVHKKEIEDLMKGKFKK
jgi:hypothetical protein